ncbi:MAG: hypothetical protein H7Z21_08360 [Hymenobacter sp.]|nr:hypothetical protein [Hymenobacter sp.]
MMDLCAPIVPGESAAGLHIGQLMSEILDHQTPTSVEHLESVTRYEFGPVWVWARNNRVDQIGVFHGYQGGLPQGIGVGAQMQEVQETIGDVFEDEEDNLCVVDSPGWCFETSPWHNGQEADKNLAAVIVGIFVSAKPKVGE